MKARNCLQVAAGLLLFFASIETSAAADDGLAGAAIRLSQSASREKLQLSAKDSAVAFPATGSSDDPAAVGATLELRSAAGETVTVDLPAGGWTATSTGYAFKSKLLPENTTTVRTARLKNARAFKIIGTAVDFAADAALEAVSARLSIGTSRYCAVFSGEAIDDNEPGKFSAKADSSALADCEDSTMADSSCAQDAWPSCSGACVGGGECASDGVGACVCSNADADCTDPYPSCAGSCGAGGLGSCGPDIGSSECKCIHPSQPCGDTSPMCSGTCGAGEVCASIATASDFSPECICLPDGATPCGLPAAPTCGGECDGGRVCEPIFQFPSSGGDLVCTCGTSAACGSGGLDCADGFACGMVGGPPSCLPMFCSGTYPTCGGSCGDGGTCRPLDIEGVTETCVCAAPDSTSCDVCGGIVCPGGEVCRVASGPTCGCETP